MYLWVSFCPKGFFFCASLKTWTFDHMDFCHKGFCLYALIFSSLFIHSSFIICSSLLIFHHIFFIVSSLFSSFIVWKIFREIFEVILKLKYLKKNYYKRILLSHGLLLLLTNINMDIYQLRLLDFRASVYGFAWPR